MNRESQIRKIRRFLEGKGKKDLDAFCIYQWVERCHYHSWWDLAVALAPCLPPNALDRDYHRRLDFLLLECRKNLQSVRKELVELKNPGAKEGFYVPKSFWNTCNDLGIELEGRSSRNLKMVFLGKRLFCVEGIETAGCVFRFPDWDAESLTSWLNSRGFAHIAKEVIWPRKGSQKQKARLKISWANATNLIPSIIEEAKTDPFVLWEGLMNAIRNKRDCTWRGYLAFIRDRYGIILTDDQSKKTRRLFVAVCEEAGDHHLAKRLSVD